MGCPTEVEIGDNLVFSVCTHDPDTGVLTDADAVPSYRIYEDETATPILTGDMAKLDDANTTGFYTESIACTSGNGFENGKTYTIYIVATVDSDQGAISFSCKAYDHRKANVKQISDDGTAADDLELLVENSKGTDHKVLVSTDAQDLSSSLDVNTKLIEGSDPTDQINSAVDDALDTAIPGTPTANSINERLKAIDDKLPSKDYLTGTANSDGDVEINESTGDFTATQKASIQSECKDAIDAKIVVRENTAQAGGTNTITLDSGASSVDDLYVNQTIYLVSGTGAGQSRKISGYVGSTKVATVDSNWATQPDNTTGFIILASYILTGTGASASEVWSYGTRILTGNDNFNDPTPDQIADGVWDEAASGHTGGGTFGGKLQNKVPSASVNDYKADVSNLDAAISSRSSHSAGDVWSVATRTLTSFGTLVTDIWHHLTSAITQSGSIGKQVKDNLDATVSSRSDFNESTDKVTLSDATETQIDNIEGDTNELQGLISGSKIAAQVKGADADTINASALATDAVNEIRDAILDKVIDGSIDLEEVLKITLAVLAGDMAKSENIYTYKDQSGNTKVTAAVSDSAVERTIGG